MPQTHSIQRIEKVVAINWTNGMVKDVTDALVVMQTITDALDSGDHVSIVFESGERHDANKPEVE